MELRQVRYFVTVAQERHFGRAAERLHMTQPALSRQVAALERELGVELLRRTSRRVEITAAGAELLTGAERLLAELDRTVARTRSAAAGRSGHVALGFVATAALDIIPAALGRMRRERPDVVVSLSELTTGDQLQQIARGELDIGIGRDAPETPDADVVVVGRERILIALPEAHPRAAADRIDPRALRDEVFVKLPREQAVTVDDLVRQIQGEGSAAAPGVWVAHQYLTLLSLVGAQIGLALVPESVSRLGPPGVVYRLLADTDARSSLTMATPRGAHNPAAGHLARVVREVAEG